jgi:hypothetical protein
MTHVLAQGRIIRRGHGDAGRATAIVNTATTNARVQRGGTSACAAVTPHPRRSPTRSARHPRCSMKVGSCQMRVRPLRGRPPCDSHGFSITDESIARSAGAALRFCFRLRAVASRVSRVAPVTTGLDDQQQSAPARRRLLLSPSKAVVRRGSDCDVGSRPKHKGGWEVTRRSHRRRSSRVAAMSVAPCSLKLHWREL